MHRNVYPFAAIIGQKDLKRSLLLNAVNPAVGGVLIREEKGTAKSTTVRALAALLPDIEVVKGCPFSCRPHQPDAACDNCRKSGNALRGTRRRPLMEIADNVQAIPEKKVIGDLQEG